LNSFICYYFNDPHLLTLLQFNGRQIAYGTKHKQVVHHKILPALTAQPSPLVTLDPDFSILHDGLPGSNMKAGGQCRCIYSAESPDLQYDPDGLPGSLPVARILNNVEDIQGDGKFMHDRMTGLLDILHSSFFIFHSFIQHILGN
jgi:hypothetical protein